MRRIGFVLLIISSVLHGQSINGSLTGHITDPSDALVVEAKIAAISEATNIRYESTTNMSGQYFLTNLPPSSYRIEVEKPGFKQVVKPDVILNVQDALAIDFQVAVGSVSDHVDVEAGEGLANNVSGAVSTVVDRTFVENLPLNGRSFQTLISLTPGVVLTAATLLDQGQFSVNGQ